MKIAPTAVCVALLAAGCTSTTSTYSMKDPHDESTLKLCRVWSSTTDQSYRNRVAQILVKRGASVEKCQRLISSDDSTATTIAIATAAAAGGIAAANSGYGGGGYYSGGYGVAWDQFYNQNYQLIWRCRDKASGRFVNDYQCGGEAMVDTTWPGWSA